MKRQKVETAAVKRQRDRGSISSSNKDDDNYYSNTNDTDSD